MESERYTENCETQPVSSYFSCKEIEVPLQFVSVLLMAASRGVLTWASCSCSSAIRLPEFCAHKKAALGNGASCSGLVTMAARIRHNV